MSLALTKKEFIKTLTLQLPPTKPKKGFFEEENPKPHMSCNEVS
jgi:hypothetical protein